MDAPIQPIRLRKLPVTVEALPFDGTAEAATDIIGWVLRNGGTASLSCKAENGDPCPGDLPGGHTIAVQTLEGTMHASSGWWIVRGVEGEFYPCKHSVIETSYELAGEGDVLRTEEQQEYAEACEKRSTFIDGCTGGEHSPGSNELCVMRPAGRELLEDGDGAPHPAEVQHTERFFLWRETDVTEVTVKPGEEPKCVAVGVEFADGKVALWWSNGSVAVWDSISGLRDTHLHERSRTTLVWVDN